MIYFIVTLITACAATMLVAAAISAPIIGHMRRENKENTDD